jgi:hypothetical protein
VNRFDTDAVSFADNTRSEDAVVEVPVLLEAQLWKALEAAARTHDMTAGAMVRCLLRDFLCYSDSGASVREPRNEARKASLC